MWSSIDVSAKCFDGKIKDMLTTWPRALERPSPLKRYIYQESFRIGRAAVNENRFEGSGGQELTDV